MLQRVQSIFLLAATILSFIMLVSPLSSIMVSSGDMLKFYSVGIRNFDQNNELIYPTIPLFILILITTLISFIAIFFFQKRIIQMRLCVYNILLMLGLIGLLLFYSFIIKKYLGTDLITHSFSFPVIFPVINIVLIFQAFRGIRRDELLIKAYERLR